MADGKWRRNDFPLSGQRRDAGVVCVGELSDREGDTAYVCGEVCVVTVRFGRKQITAYEAEMGGSKV